MERTLVARGMLAGAVAGLLAFVFARIFAEPRIQAAIDYESGRDAAQSVLDSGAVHDAHGTATEVFSRTVQADIGSGVALILFGLAMGTLFAVVFMAALGRCGGVRPRMLALLVAGGGLLAGYLAPFVKYPANPPGVGDPDTIGTRTMLYLITVLASVAVLAGAVWLGRRLRSRLGAWNSTLVAGAAFVVVMGVLFVALPGFAETPTELRAPDGTIVYGGFPADVLAGFRMYSVLTQVALWAAIGLVFGPLAERALARGRVGAERAVERSLV